MKRHRYAAIRDAAVALAVTITALFVIVLCAIALRATLPAPKALPNGMTNLARGDAMNNEMRWEMRWAVDRTYPTGGQRGAAGRQTAEELLADGWEPFATLPDSPEAPPVVYFRRRVIAS